MAQLAGQIESNRALIAAWVDFPFGRVGNYMLILGMLIFGISVIRAGVFSAWAGWLIVIGIALFLPAQFQSQAYLFIIFWAIGATLAGLGFGWTGWTLFRNRDSQKAT
jgi:membrane protein implicated in regulation of membrane protease activity